MVWACAHQRMVNIRLFQKRMVVEKKENLLNIYGLNKKKVETIDFLFCKVPKKWFFER
jgi:hypothetical protein